jgi:hypothetical protein
MLSYKIHPAIGFARLGNSPDFYLGPMIPGVDARPASYRDSSPQKRLKKQGAQFWVYVYDSTKPSAEPVRIEVGPGKDVSRVEWTVHVANRKAAWFKFDGLTGALDILNPPDFGYPAGSLRNPSGSRDQWTIDPGPSTVSTPGDSKTFSKTTTNGVWPTFTAGNSTGIDTLGEMRVGADSGLTVLGGSGNSGSVSGSGIGNFANNPGWFDDTSDGSVRASVVLKDGSVVEADPAWVVVGPPDFAPPIANIVTMYDAIYDVAVRTLGFDKKVFDAGQFVPGFTPSFEAHIFPILYRAFLYRWVYDESPPAAPTFHSTLDKITQLGKLPTAGSDPNKARRLAVFNRLRAPANANATGHDDGKMPKIHGDTGEGRSALTLTLTQYEMMTRWRDGKFTRGKATLPLAPPAAVTASGLDRAALEACVGGAFYPGIECGWIVREHRLYATPFAFRFRHAVSESDPTGVWPGDVTKRSAVPWQADFYKCNNNWWPAQRPNQVRRSATAADVVQWTEGIGSHMVMVKLWHELGVVVKDPAADVYFEDERNLVRP